MLQIKVMGTGDFVFAEQLSNLMHWNNSVEDFRFMKTLEPEGCFIAFLDSEPVGIATSISFGNIGWFGNLIVHEKHRRKGIGGRLVNYSIEFLESKGTKTVGLYAKSNLTDYYQHLGFRKDADFVVLQATLEQSLPATLARTSEANLKRIFDFDLNYFGSDRTGLLRSLYLKPETLTYCFSDKTGVVGYAMTKNYGKTVEVGPLICKLNEPDVAKLLLQNLLSQLKGLQISLCLPQKDVVLIEYLKSWGFTESFVVSRMWRGRNPIKDCHYIAESLERG